MKKIYLDTNQLFYIRRIADESQGWDYGDYSWAYKHFKNDPQMIADIKALCYIVALQYEWDLEFSTSDASYTELCHMLSDRALKTREAWSIFTEGLETGEYPKRIPFVTDRTVRGRLNLEFIPDKDDIAILRHFVSEGAEVFLTDDNHILEHKSELSSVGIEVMRPTEWLNNFLGLNNILNDIEGNEDGIKWLERILFKVGT